MDLGDLYTSLERALPALRRRLGRPLTLTDKVLLGHLYNPEEQPLGPGEATLRLRPDRVILQDVLGQTAFLQFGQTGRDRVALPVSVHCDHLIQARVGARPDLADSLAEDDEVYEFLRSAAARYGADFWPPGAGIIHQVALESYALPGLLILGTDSHTPNAGGAGACAIGVGGADAVEAMAGLPFELLHPRRIAVHLDGALDGWTAPKDVILAVAGILTTAGGTGAVIEYIGPGARTLGASGRATICNMGAEVGATTSLFPTDAATLRYLEATGRGALASTIARHLELLAPDPEAEADPESCYDRVIRIDLGALEPHVTGPASPDRARPLSALAAEAAREGWPRRISAALIGSCTNSSYADLSRVADVADQAAARGIQAACDLMVAPGSERIRATVARDGQLAALEALGARTLASACGPCIGQWRRDAIASSELASRPEPQTIVTTFNRNFPGRNDGRRETLNFLVSPEIAAALALAGRLDFDPRRDPLIDGEGRPFYLRPPAPAPEVPARGFVAAACVAPPADGRGIDLRLDPASERLQALPPWPAWDGADRVEAPVLIKAIGKTTTDQIAPAGPWLRFRGHLERFSACLLAGARDAFTGAIGEVVDPASGALAPIAEVARRYRDAGRPWVIVGDENYGEGSSREHAALAPRYLGGFAVIARSFARIHEANLKKQGLLACTFVDPADYDRIGPGDRLSILDLAAMAPGRPLRATIHRPSGETIEIALRHSYAASQIEWFRAGSALASHRAA